MTDTTTLARRCESLRQSVKDMQGKPGIQRLRAMLYEAQHTLLAAELQGGGNAES